MAGQDNEVWGLARFSGANALAEVESAGVIPYRRDLEKGDFSELPDDFTYVLHLAALSFGADYDRGDRGQRRGTGLLLHHCRRAKAALVMSTHSVYKPHEDPRHPYIERDPLGDANTSISPAYSVSKIAQEAVARYCARAFDLPVVIARMNVYTAQGRSARCPSGCRCDREPRHYEVGSVLLQPDLRR